MRITQVGQDTRLHPLHMLNAGKETVQDRWERLPSFWNICESHWGIYDDPIISMIEGRKKKQTI